MFYETEFDVDAIRPETILFWGTVGPQTGLAVVLADRPSDLLAWLRERAAVEGRSSHLARALVSIEAQVKKAGEKDPELGADALGAALEEAGVPVHVCGPLLRELAANEPLREVIWAESLTETSPAPEGVWRGGEAGREVEGSSVSPSEGNADEPARAYAMDDEIEEWAEHQTIDFERPDHREFLMERLDELRTAAPRRRAA